MVRDELARLAVGDEHAHAVARQAPGLRRLVRLEVGIGGRRRGAPVIGPPHEQVGGPDAAARRSLGQEAQQGGDHRLWLGPVGDVLAGEGVLVHAGAHVAGVEPPHAEGGLLGGEDGAELFERRLRRPVPAPALVGLHGGVGGDVHDRPSRGPQEREGELHQAEGRQGVDAVHLLDGVERDLGPAAAAATGRGRWRC